MDDDNKNTTLHGFNNEDNFLIEKIKKSFWSSDEDKLIAIYKKEQEFLQGNTDIPKELINNVANRLVNTEDGLVISLSMPPPIIKALSQIKNACPWNITISYDKNYLAILQDDSVVIVSKELDYDFRSQKIIKIDNDPFPCWRTIAFSLDSSLIAVSSSHGQIKIYRLSDSELIYVIQPKSHVETSIITNNGKEGKHILFNNNSFNQNNNSKIGIIDPVVSLQFIDPKRGKTKATPYNGKIYSYELLVINHTGTLRSYLFNVESAVPTQIDTPKHDSNMVTISSEGHNPDHSITFYHKFSFKPWLNVLVTSTFDLENNLLFLGGINKDSITIDSSLNGVQKEKQASKSPENISFVIWKLTSSLPFYIKYNSYEQSKYNDSTKKLKIARPSIWDNVKNNILLRNSIFVDNIVHSLALSPNKEYLLTLDFAGTINLWKIKNEELIMSITKKDLNPLIQKFSNNISNEQSNTTGKHNNSISDISNVFPNDISWWSDSSIVLSFNNGFVGVLNLNRMDNIMGDHLELFNANPLIADLPGEKVIVLSYTVKSKNVRYSGGSFIEDKEDEEEDDADKDSMLVKIMDNVIVNPLNRIVNKNLLIPNKEYVTIVERQYSLYILANTLPIDVFYHRIANLDFKGALDLAEKYKLDTDCVYQAQWLSSNVSEKSISDYLKKIKNNVWVIESCLDRIPSTPEDLLLLINYGLSLTDLKNEVHSDPLFTSTNIWSCTENLKVDANNSSLSIHRNSQQFLSPSKRYALSHSGNSAEIITNDTTDITENIDLSLDHDIIPSNINITGEIIPEVSIEPMISKDQNSVIKPNYNCDICFYRLFLLKYLDRLKTYEEIMKLGHTKELKENFSVEFAKFRDVNLVLQAMLYAVDEKFDELKILFNRHTDELLPYRMNILEYIPEAVDPNLYEFLLPEIENNSYSGVAVQLNEKLWPNKNPWRTTPDWVESDNIKAVIQWEDDVPENVEPFVNIRVNEYPASTETITQWYINRVHSIEKNTGLVCNALNLVQLGINKNVPNLETLHEDLITLSSLVYDCFTVNGSNSVDIDLETLEKLNEQETINLFMKETKSKRVVSDIRYYVIPYLERLVQRWRRNDFYHNPIDLLSNYIRKIAEDHIEWCCLIMEASHPVIPIDQRLIKDDILLSHLIVDCSYLNKEENNLQYIRRMFNCIPALDSEMYQDMNEALQQELEDLDETIDRFDDHLASLELLEKYDICLPLSWFNEAAENSDMQRSLLLKLTRKVSTDVDLSKITISEINNPKNKKYQEWETLWDDILTLREYGALDDVPITEIQADFVSALLNGGQFALAKQTLFDKDENDYILPHSVIEKIVINASQEFFDNSESGSSNYGPMMLARECLQVIDPIPAIEEELNLIDAVDILSQYKLKIKSKSDIPILPIQVRMCENRLEFIQKILNLDTNDYTKTGKLLDLSKKLLGQNFNIGKEAVVRTMIGNAAINHNNYNFANEICKTIMTIDKNTIEENNDIWKLFYRLATDSSYKNTSSKIELIGHALTLCPPEQISDILIFSRELEAEQLLNSSLDYINVNITDKDSGSILSHASSIKKSIQSFEEDELYGKHCTTIVKHPFFNQSFEVQSSYNYGFYESSNVRSEYIVNNNINNELFIKSYKHQILSNIFIRLEQIRKSGIINNPLFNKYTLINDDDIRKLALDYFSKDSEISIACLFDLNEDQEIDRFFNKIHPSIYREQFACYFFALRCLYSWLSYENPDVVLLLHRYHPKSVISALNDIIDIYENNNDDIDDTNITIYNEALKAKHYASLLKEKRQEYIFQTFFNENFVNQEQFESDPIYRERTLENLICTTNSEKIENTLLLCNKYGIPTKEKILHHIQWLFTCPSLKSSDIEKCILSCREIVKHNPEDVINMFNILHEQLNGNQILKLVQFYKFYLQAYNHLSENHDPSIINSLEERIKLLTFFFAIDNNSTFNIKQAIKALYSDPEEMKLFLTPLLNEKNIDEIINIMPVMYTLRAIPSLKDEEVYRDKEIKSINEDEMKSMCYYSLILSMIQDKNGLVDNSLLIKSIPKIENLLSNLSYSYLLTFITDITTGGNSKNLSIESRITLLDIALSYLHKDNDEKAVDIIASLEDIHSHLELIVLFKKLFDPNLKEYISQEWCEEFENIYNQPNDIPLNICSRMIVQGISPYLIYQTSVILQNRCKMIALIKNIESTTEDFDVLNIYTKTLNTIIMTKEVYPLRALGLSSSEALFEDILDWVIYTTISYDVQDLEDKKWHEKLENGIFEYLKNVIANTESDNTLTNEKRRKLIEIFNRQFQSKIIENTNITNILQSTKIQCILRDNWNVEYSVDVLNDEQQYVDIIKYLLEKSDAVTQIKAITEILNEWMFNNPNNSDEDIIKDIKEIPDSLKECWKLFMLWMIDHQFYQKLFYLRLKYIKYDLLGSENEKEILAYLKKNTKNYIYYLQNVMLTKENSQIKIVIPEIVKLLESGTKNEIKVAKKKRVSTIDKGNKSIDNWGNPISNNNVTENNNDNGWNVPFNYDIPLQEEPKSMDNKINSNGWNMSYNSNVLPSEQPKIPSSNISNSNSHDGWDVSFDFNIPSHEMKTENKNPPQSKGSDPWNSSINKPEEKVENNSNGWDIPLDLNITSSKPEEKGENTTNGWDVSFDFNLPEPEPELKMKDKIESNANGWDVPLDFNIPEPEPELKVKSEIKSVENNVNGWDTPLDLNDPLPVPPLENKPNKEESSLPKVKSNNTDGWNVTFEFDNIPEPEPENKPFEKGDSNVNGWNIPFDINLPGPGMKSKSENEPFEDGVNGWDIPLDLNVPSPENKPIQKETPTPNVQNEEISGWDISMDIHIPSPEFHPKEKPTQEKTPLPEEQNDNVNGWDVPMDLNIPSPELQPKDKSVQEEAPIPVIQNKNEPQSEIKSTQDEAPLPDVNGWDVPMDLNIPSPELQPKDKSVQEEAPIPVIQNENENELQPEIQSTQIEAPLPDVNGWDVPMDLNIPSPELQPKDKSVQEEAPIPIIQNENENELQPKIQSTQIETPLPDVNGWDVPMDLNIPSPELQPKDKSVQEEVPAPEIQNENELPTEVQSTQDEAPLPDINGWDVPMDLNIPSPELKPTQEQEQENDNDKKKLEQKPETVVEENESNVNDQEENPVEDEVVKDKEKNTEENKDNSIIGKSKPEEKEEKKPNKEEENNDPLNGWGIPLDINSLPQTSLEATPLSTEIKAKEDNDWGIQLDVSTISMPPLEATRLSSSPVPPESQSPEPVAAAIINELKEETEEKEEPVMDRSVHMDATDAQPPHQSHESPSEVEVKKNETQTVSADEVLLQSSHEDITKQVIESIRSDRRLHILLCSRGWTLPFVMSPLFGPMIQSVLTPVTLVQSLLHGPASASTTTQSLMTTSHKYSEYHQLLSYIVATLVSSGFMNEAARLVFLYMKGDADRGVLPPSSQSQEQGQEQGQGQGQVQGPEEIHIGLVHRYKLLKAYLKKTQAKVNRRLKNHKPKDHETTGILVHLNDQPQSIENAIIQEFVSLEQVKERLDQAVKFLEEYLYEY